MKYIDSYYSRIIALVTELYHQEFNRKTPGHCMKITGLRQHELELLWDDITTKYSHLNTFVISANGEADNNKYITATKLIEFRNMEDKPLLILIPANSRTAAEDSYGNPTFKEISLEAVEDELYHQLLNQLPSASKANLDTILKHPFSHLISKTDIISYLIFLDENGYSKENIGDGLFFLHLIPDSKLLIDKAKIRSRLNLNMQCAEILCDFSKPLFDRITGLPIPKNTIQSEIFGLYKEHSELKERNKIVQLFINEYKSLNFANWPINESNPNEFELFVDDITSKDFINDEGRKVLKVREDKSSKLTLKIRTIPKPIELENVKFFRIVLMQVDGASGTEVMELRKMKKTATQQHFRKAQVELNPNIIEEGTYFFRVFAEDETGAKLNIQDKFKEVKIQESWEEDIEEINKLSISEEDKKEKINEILDAQYQFKRTSDSEDFDFELDGGVEETPTLRKDKVKNRLQAYFAFRIGQLKSQNELLIPTIEPDSGMWLNDTPNKLNATYYLKYNNSHNYQINIPNKLRIIEWMMLENASEFGQVDVVTRSDASAIDFESFLFKSSHDVNHLMPEDLLNLRVKLFKAVKASSSDDKGIFETFDFYNHIELIREYLRLFTLWTSDLKEQFSNVKQIETQEKEELHKLFIELQNIDLVKLKMRLPNQTPIETHLLSPLHPLRLAWHLQLFDLFNEWEQRTVNFEGHLKEWKHLEDLFNGQIFPENNPLALVGHKALSTYQYAGELFHNWGIYIKSKYTKEENTFSSINRQVITYLRNILNVATENYIDTDISKGLIVRHIRNYVSQHPYIDKLIINLFNAGDAIVFSDALVDIEKYKELSHITYEIRLFKGKDTIIHHGEGLKQLINPEFNVSEEAESFSQQTKNRLSPKLRFSVSPISEFIESPSKYLAHVSFLVNLFPVHTQLLKVKKEHSNFFMNGVITDPGVQVDESSAEIKWNRFIYPNRLVKPINSFTNTGIQLFENIQSFTAAALGNKMTDSFPSTQLQLNEKDNVHISLVHDNSDWVITFDRNLGPEAFDQPNNNGHIPFLLDYIPGEEVSGISSFLTTRPNSEILGLLIPHFEEFNIDILNKDEHIATSILLEDLRAISSSLVMQLNSGKNKAFEVIGSAFTKRVLEKKDLLNESFLIPIDLHQHLFNNSEFENKSRADNLLVRFDLEKRNIEISVIEIKCRSSLTEMDKVDLKSKIKEQIINTIDTLRFHFSPDFYLSEDRLDREIKNKELKSLLGFYIERAKRYNYLEPQVAQLYLDFINTLDLGFQINFKQFGFIFDFGALKKHDKDYFDDELIVYSFGEKLISEILDPDSNLNTQRLEDVEFDKDLRKELGDSSKISDFLKNLSKDIKHEYPDKSDVKELKEPIIPIKPTPSSEEVDIVPEPKPVKIESVKVEELKVIEEFKPPNFDLLIGKNSPSQQYGIIGQSTRGKKIALDLSETNTISLFGVQGGGKSYSIGTVAEMVLKQFENVNLLPSPLAGVIFHYSESMDYEPEFTSMIYPNDIDRETNLLKEIYGAEPDNIKDVILLCPSRKVEQRKSEFPSVDVRPISFTPSELNIRDWQFLMNALGNSSDYINELNMIMEDLEDDGRFTIENFKKEIEENDLLSKRDKSLALRRIKFASKYVKDDQPIKDLLKPGRLLIVDLRDEFIHKDQALGLFVIMLNVFSSITDFNGKSFNKFIVFDEAHKYMDNKDLTSNIVSSIREMRHKGVSIMIASQDPPSLPNEIIELSSIVITHKFNSPQWLKHIQKSITQLVSLQPADLSALHPGEAFLWATKATDKTITNKPLKINTRPRVTKHGGGTIKATDK